ncbi:helix-turn-helix transcriptional regulator [Quadrisphaera sp. KR29]|uniref:helix-turn-helix transcriptional regulator n=1 Tax=Quadrisphaera sp. KR29 TaxID=3461391 RepID=UPI00404458B2
MRGQVPPSVGTAQSLSRRTGVVVSEFLLTREVADLLRTSESTVRYWRYTGDGPASVKVGRRVLYRREAVLAWLAGLETAGPVREERAR